MATAAKTKTNTTTKPKTSATKSTASKVNSTPIEATDENVEIVNEVIEETDDIEEVKEVEKVKVVAKEKRKYEATDGIPCESITSGELGMVGIKSGINYKWADRNDITDVEYQDIIAAIRSNTDYVFKPYFIIRDEEIINQFPQVDEVYASMYSLKDLKDVLRMDVGNMISTIESLPDGAKQSIKNIAATMIQNGSLDSVQKIKAIDNLFDTKLMMMTELYNE